jgi:outer membrane protein TolC
MNRLVLLGFISIITHGLFAQKIMQQYVDQAIQYNLRIREKKILEHKQTIMLDEASRQYGPEINFITNYTLAVGGRKIDFPVGTLLNPVYNTLNELTESQQFHTVNDQSINFLPNNFYDVKFRITQPILRPEIKYNKWIKEEEVNMSELQTNETTRDLIRDVKTAYLKWMQAKEVINIFDQGLSLLEENKRITESLLKNGQAIPSALMRIESEINLVNAQQNKARTDLTNAASYFNFLLNQPASTPIINDTIETTPEIPVIANVTSREELQQIKSGEHMQALALTLEQKHFAPKLGAQVDIGSQAFGADWGGYVLGGLQLEIPIWDSKKSRLKQQGWQASLDANQTSYEWTKQAFEMQLQAEIESLQSDLAIYDSYTSMITSDNRYYQETLRRYKEGMTNYIELLDARTHLTNTQLQQSIAKYQSWIRQVNIERLSATASIQ